MFVFVKCKKMVHGLTQIKRIYAELKKRKSQRIKQNKLMNIFFLIRVNSRHSLTLSLMLLVVRVNPHKSAD